MVVRGTKLQLCSINKPRDLIYNLMNTVNNIVLKTGSLLRGQISGALTTHKKNNCVEMINLTPVIISLP